MSHEGKEQCPICKKWYKNLDSHMKRVHGEGGSSASKKKGKSTDSLERALAKKILTNSNQQSSNVVLSSKTEVKEGKKKGDVKSKSGKDSGFKRTITVDFWLTDLHGAEIGVYQKQRYMAKNRLFSRNLELVGAVKEEGKTPGMFGFNSADWNDIPENEITTKRLVVKWFNSESVAWLGTIEQMVILTLRASIGSNDTLPVFKVIIPKYPYVIDLSKQHTKLPKIGEIFTFALKDEKNDKWQVYTFDENRFTIGSDWNILEGTDRVVGKIDEKKFNVGGKFIVDFYDEELYKNRNFKRVILLFTMMLKWHTEIEHLIKHMKKGIADGELEYKISAEEEEFMRNPRAMKR